jgi:succinate-semialdehyde dehydrogenase/glutarate-semialdehyde dehydrogenase
MSVMKEEVFGPVAAIMPFSSDEQVIDYANRSDYGLGSSIWTQDMQRARRLAEKLESGSVYINTLMKSDVSLPFGGVKRSGYGRELSSQGFYEFVNIKSVVEA